MCDIIFYMIGGWNVLKKISIIVPCYCEEKSLPFFYKEINNVSESMKDVVFEYIFIDDGSKDDTINILKEYAKNDKRVRYISFSRNFGKESAMLAGLEKATGDYIAVMDADLQDPPGLLPKMLDSILNEGYDCVATRRVDRKGEPPIRSFFARMFYRLINKISKTEVVDGARDFRLMTRQMVDAIISLKEYNRFSKGIFGWVGFKTKWIDYENTKRVAGETKWSFWKLLKYSIDGIVAFSTTPLLISALFGILFCIFALIMIVFIIVKTLVFGDPVSGWPSLVCIVFLVGGVQLFCTGILGIYLSKAYMETKGRPLYIIKEENKIGE